MTSTLQEFRRAAHTAGYTDADVERAVAELERRGLIHRASLNTANPAKCGAMAQFLIKQENYDGPRVSQSAAAAEKGASLSRGGIK